MIEIKILSLAAQGEMIQHQMSQICPAVRQKWASSDIIFTSSHQSHALYSAVTFLPSHGKPLNGLWTVCAHRALELIKADG